MGKPARTRLPVTHLIDSPSSHALTILPHDAAAPATLRLKKVVLAAGPWTAALCATLGLPVPPVSNLPAHSLVIRSALDAIKRASPLPVGAVFAGINGQEAGVPKPGERAHRLTAENLAQGYMKVNDFPFQA